MLSLGLSPSEQAHRCALNSALYNGPFLPPPGHFAGFAKRARWSPCYRIRKRLTPTRTPAHALSSRFHSSSCKTSTIRVSKTTIPALFALQASPIMTDLQLPARQTRLQVSTTWSRPSPRDTNCTDNCAASTNGVQAGSVVACPSSIDSVFRDTCSCGQAGAKQR